MVKIWQSNKLFLRFSCYDLRPWQNHKGGISPIHSHTASKPPKRSNLNMSRMVKKNRFHQTISSFPKSLPSYSMDFVGRLLYFHGGFCLRTGERWLPGTPASTIAEGLVQGGPRGRSLGIYRGISWEIYWIIVDIYIYSGYWNSIYIFHWYWIHRISVVE